MTLLAIVAVFSFLPLLGLLARNLFIFDAILAASDDATQVLHDALVAHSTAGWIVAAVAALCLLVPLVLKALGKNVPLLDTVVEVVLSVAKSFVKPKDEAAKVEEQPGAKAVGNVVPITDLANKDKKDAGL